MNKINKIILKTLSVIFVIIILYFILRGIGFINIYNTVKKANILFIILSILSTLAFFLAWNYKWYVLVKEVKKPKFLGLFPILLAGSFINTITPGARVGGEPLRAYYLSKQYKKEKSKFFATTIVDKAINSLAFAAMSAFSILFVIIFVKIGVWVRFVLETALIILSIVIIGGLVLKQKIKITKKQIALVLTKIYYFYLFKLIRKKFTSYKKFENYMIKKLNNILKTSKKLRTRKIFKKDLSLSFLMWFFNYLGTFFLFIALNHKINFIAIIVVVTLSTLLGSISPVPGGVGIIEAIMISLYLTFGINSGIAATVAVLDRLIYYFYSLLIGGISLFYLNTKYG